MHRRCRSWRRSWLGCGRCPRREQPSPVGVVEVGDKYRVESGEGTSEGFALSENRDPGQTRLEALEGKPFEQGAVVGDWRAPLVVVVGEHERVGRCVPVRPPAAQSLVRTHRERGGGAAFIPRRRRRRRQWPAPAMPPSQARHRAGRVVGRPCPGCRGPSSRSGRAGGRSRWRRSNGGRPAWPARHR